MKYPKKPPALARGDSVRIVSTASPADETALQRGTGELERLGYRVLRSRQMAADGYFAGSQARRRAQLEGALGDGKAEAVICSRGGYGSSALLDLQLARSARPKLVVGYSDVTVLHAFLWQRLGWTSIYGPMVAAGFAGGADQTRGYDLASFQNAVEGQRERWILPLAGESLLRGDASGVLLGGCVTLVETTLGTPWELDTRGAILLLEDVGLKPYQLDRMLLHLQQAGKFRGVRGFVLGDFLGCDPPPPSRVTARDVCLRILGPLGLPMVFAAPVGHTERPMLTVPLGVRARLRARGEGQLEILEPAVTKGKRP
jgi:muramoyltetrapeptide carboxypeptidase